MLHFTEAIRIPHISNLQLPLEFIEWSQNFSWVFLLPGPQSVLLTSHTAFSCSSKTTSPAPSRWTWKVWIKGCPRHVCSWPAYVFSKTGLSWWVTHERPTCPGRGELLEQRGPWRKGTTGPLKLSNQSSCPEMFPLTGALKSPSEGSQMFKQMENRCLLVKNT